MGEQAAFLIVGLGGVVGIVLGTGAVRLVQKQEEMGSVAKGILSCILFLCCVAGCLYLGVWGCAAVVF